MTKRRRRSATRKPIDELGEAIQRMVIATLEEQRATLSPSELESLGERLVEAVRQELPRSLVETGVQMATLMDEGRHCSGSPFPHLSFCEAQPARSLAFDRHDGESKVATACRRSVGARYAT
jgi:hypothetical protein